MEIIPLYKGKTKNILVISGGGVKGFAALGALANLIDNDIISFPEIFAGTSVGAIICFLINIGYGPRDMYSLLEEIDFTKIIKYIEPEKMFSDCYFGISYPKLIIQIIYSFMKKKNINKNITFKELFDITQSKLIITGTCINDVSIKYFSIDTCPNMSILKALRITISIPILFKPYLFEGKIWIDGGCMNNFPINLFNDKLDDVIGIYLDDNFDFLNEITEIQDYFYRIFNCVCKGIDYNKIELYKKYFVHIITHGNNGTNWNIIQQEKKDLFNVGYECAKKYIENQDYNNN